MMEPYTLKMHWVMLCRTINIKSLMLNSTLLNIFKESSKAFVLQGFCWLCMLKGILLNRAPAENVEEVLLELIYKLFDILWLVLTPVSLFVIMSTTLWPEFQRCPCSIRLEIPLLRGDRTFTIAGIGCVMWSCLGRFVHQRVRQIFSWLFTQRMGLQLCLKWKLGH